MYDKRYYKKYGGPYNFGVTRMSYAGRHGYRAGGSGLYDVRCRMLAGMVTGPVGVDYMMLDVVCWQAWLQGRWKHSGWSGLGRTTFWLEHELCIRFHQLFWVPKHQHLYLSHGGPDGH